MRCPSVGPPSGHLLPWESFGVRTAEQSNSMFESGWGMYRSHRPLNKHTDPESAAHMEA